MYKNRLIKDLDYIKYYCMVKNNDWKSRLGMVYSTNPDFEYIEDKDEEVETLPKNRQRLRVRIEKNGRGGKTVSVISGFVGCEADLKDMAKMLKVKCGVGGSVKDGEVIIQGDFKERLVQILKADGYQDTK